MKKRELKAFAAAAALLTAYAGAGGALLGCGISLIAIKLSEANSPPPVTLLLVEETTLTSVGLGLIGGLSFGIAPARERYRRKLEMTAQP